MACCGKKTFIIRCQHASTAVTLRVIARDEATALKMAAANPSGKGATEYLVLRSF